MDIRKVVEQAAGGELRAEYLKKLSNELYPAAFSSPDSWLAVKRALDLHDAYVKEYVIQALEQLAKES